MKRKLLEKPKDFNQWNFALQTHLPTAYQN